MQFHEYGKNLQLLTEIDTYIKSNSLPHKCVQLIDENERQSHFLTQQQNPGREPSPKKTKGLQDNKSLVTQKRFWVRERKRVTGNGLSSVCI